MKRVQFDMVSTPDPHEERRREILAEFPEVKSLMTIESKTKYYIAINILLQLFAITYAVTIDNIQSFLVFAYVVGGTLNHSLFLAIHELSHNTAFKSIAHNQYMAIAANLPIGIPYASSFRRYHLQHHYRLGQVGVRLSLLSVPCINLKIDGIAAAPSVHPPPPKKI